MKLAAIRERETVYALVVTDDVAFDMRYCEGRGMCRTQLLKLGALAYTLIAANHEQCSHGNSAQFATLFCWKLCFKKQGVGVPGAAAKVHFHGGDQNFHQRL